MKFMIATIVAMIVAVAIVVMGEQPLFSAPEWSFVFAAMGALFMALAPIIFAVMTNAVQRASRQSFLGLVSLFHQDRIVRSWTLYFTLFPLLSFIMAFFLRGILSPHIVIAVWIVLLGLALDGFRLFAKRSYIYMDPFLVIERLTHAANISLQEELTPDIRPWIDHLTEMAHKESPALTTKAVSSMEVVLSHFLNCSKSISHEATTADTVSYALIYLFQRMEFLFDNALKGHREIICSHIMTTLGKMAFTTARFDLSLVPLPIHSLGKLTLRAQNSSMPEVGIKASLTLIEVSRLILTEIDLTYAELDEPFLAINRQLHEIEKTAFRQDKSLSISLLSEPFQDLKTLFQSGKVATHRDSPLIIADIDRIISEFTALEGVLKSLPKP